MQPGKQPSAIKSHLQSTNGSTAVDQLLQVDCTNILESKFGSTIKTADIQIAKDPTHASHNWLRMYSPLLLDGMKIARRNCPPGCPTDEHLFLCRPPGWY